MKLQTILTKQKRKQMISTLLRRSVRSICGEKESVTFEKYLDQVENESLPATIRQRATRSIDRFINKRLEQDGTTTNK